MERIKKSKKLALVLCALLVFMSVFNGNVSKLRAEDGKQDEDLESSNELHQDDELQDANDLQLLNDLNQEDISPLSEPDNQAASHNISFTITGNGRVDYNFYKSDGSGCSGGGAGQINQDQTVGIPSDAGKINIKAVAGQGYHRGSASGMGLDEAIYGEAGKTVDISPDSDYTVSITFEEENNPPTTQNGDIRFDIHNGQNGKVYYAVESENNWNEVNNNSIINKNNSIANGQTIYIKAEPNADQELDNGDSANEISINGNRTSITSELKEGTYSFAYDENSKYEIRIEFRGGENPPQEDNTAAGDIEIIVNNRNPQSKVEYKIGEGEVWTNIEGTRLVLNGAGELNSVVDGTKIYFKATPNNSQILDTNDRQNCIRIDGQESNISLNDLEAGSFYIEYNCSKAYEIQIKFDGGNNQGGNPNGGNPNGGNFRFNSMNSELENHVRGVYIIIKNGETWSDWEKMTSEGKTLSSGQQFKIRMEVDEGYQIQDPDFAYTSFDDRSRIGYFSNDNKPSSQSIVNALVSDNGFEMVFNPEEASKDAGDNAGMTAESAYIRMQYHIVQVYEQNPIIYMFFQDKNGDQGYGIWEEDENRERHFVTGVGDAEISFNFNNNGYGYDGPGDYNQFVVRDNTTLQIKHKSGTTFTPKSYNRFEVGGYTTGDTNNVFKLNDEDDFIDNLYVVKGENADFTSATPVASTTIDGKKCYVINLEPSSQYNFLFQRKPDLRRSVKWSYTQNDRNEDFYVDFGKVYVEEVRRNGEVVFGNVSKDDQGNIIVDQNGAPTYGINKDNYFSVGDANGNDIFVQVGDIITIRLVPYYGYQIKEAKINDMVLTPNETPSSFTFTVQGNAHLRGTFISSEDIIDTTATEVSEATIAEGGNATDTGVLNLTVADHSGNYGNAQNALEKAKTTNPNKNAIAVATLDMLLKGKVSKGNGSYWEKDITSFDENISVDLKLNDSYHDGDSYVVVREHIEGNQTTLEQIPVSYDPSTNKLSIPTNKFSTYSIVRMSDNPEQNYEAADFSIEFDARDFDDNAGDVIAKQNNNELSVNPEGNPWSKNYRYNLSDVITINLTAPKDRIGQTAVVEVEIWKDGVDDPVIITPNISNNLLTIDPSEYVENGKLSNMIVRVWWSEFDRFEPEDDQYMIQVNILNGGGEVSFDTEPVRSMNFGSESKYFFKCENNKVYLTPNGPGYDVGFIFVEGTEYSQYGENKVDSLYNEANNRYELAVSTVPTPDKNCTFIDVDFWEIAYIDGPITVMTENLDDTMTLNDVQLSGTVKAGNGRIVAGSFGWVDPDIQLTSGSQEYRYVFISNDTFEEGGNTYPLFAIEGDITLTASHYATVTSIDVTTAPSKVVYTYGESLDTTGLVVTATYSDSTTREITNFTCTGDIVPSNTMITVKYNGDPSITTTFEITVNKATIDIKDLAWTASTYTYTGSAQGPRFTSSLPTGVSVASYEDSSKTNAGDYTAVANITLANGYSSDNYELVNSTAAEGITISAQKNTAVVSKSWSIGKSTPTIILSNLSETTLTPSGVRATLSTPDATANIVVEYKVVDTPAVEAKAEVPCNVEHAEECGYLTSGNLDDCNCEQDHTSHTDECGYQAAVTGVAATYKWDTQRPVAAGSYEVRANMPVGTNNVNEVAAYTTGTYILTTYTNTEVPTNTVNEPESNIDENLIREELELEAEDLSVDLSKTDLLEVFEETVVTAIENTINEIKAVISQKISASEENVVSETEPVVEVMDISNIKTDSGFVNAMIKSAEHFNDTKCDVGVIYTGNPGCFNTKIAKVWESCERDIVWMFKHKGRMFRVTIPKGTDFSLIMDENGFAGPLYIGKVLGTTEIIEE